MFEDIVRMHLDWYSQFSEGQGTPLRNCDA